MTAAEVRDLRSDIRHWRRGRSDARLGEVLQDAYVAVFSTVLLGLMLGNVVLQSRRVLTDACTTAACADARGLLPWLVALSGLLVVVAVARLFGPVFVSPAAGSWLVSAPVDRGALLRPRLLGACGAAALVAALVALASATLGGFGFAPLITVSLAAAALGAALVAAGSLSQGGRGRLGGALSGGLALVVWFGLLLLAVGHAPRSTPPGAPSVPLLVGALGCLALAVALPVVGVRRLPAMRRDRLAGGGALAPGLSGALASLDLALVYDVLVAHRWRGHGVVRSRRGGPAGPAALVWLDLVRARRTPQRVLVLAASVTVPYAAAASGAGRVVVLLGALVGFLAGLPFLVALRVITRAPSIARAFPVPDGVSRGATVVVPAVLLAVFGLGTSAAVATTDRTDAGTAVVLGLATGIAALAGAVRWVTGRPPDYTRPLVSTPAGGVPTNLYGSVVRGFDVVLLTTAPMLLFPTPVGAVVSLALSALVVGVLLTRSS